MRWQLSLKGRASASASNGSDCLAGSWQPKQVATFTSTPHTTHVGGGHQARARSQISIDRARHDVTRRRAAARAASHAHTHTHSTHTLCGALISSNQPEAASQHRTKHSAVANMLYKTMPNDDTRHDKHTAHGDTRRHPLAIDSRRLALSHVAVSLTGWPTARHSAPPHNVNKINLEQGAALPVASRPCVCSTHSLPV